MRSSPLSINTDIITIIVPSSSSSSSSSSRSSSSSSSSIAITVIIAQSASRADPRSLPVKGIINIRPSTIG